MVKSTKDDYLGKQNEITGEVLPSPWTVYVAAALFLVHGVIAPGQLGPHLEARLSILHCVLLSVA